MNSKFVRLTEEEFLQVLLNKIKPNLSVTDYVLGIPRRNFNPLTRLFGNTVIKIKPRNPVPNKGSFFVRYDRTDISQHAVDPDLSKNIYINDSIYIYDVLDQINTICSLSLKRDDIYNTSIKEFPSGKYYVVLLVKPESYKYYGKLELEVSRQQNLLPIIKLILRTTLIPKV